MLRLKILKIILLLIVFLTPLLTPLAGFGYEQIKVLFFILMVTLAGFIWISSGKDLMKLTKIKIAAICFILSLLVTSLAGLDPQVSLLGQEPYYQGWVLYAYLLLFALMVSQVKIKREYWVVALSGAAFLVAFLALKDWVLLNVFHQDIPTYAGRVVSTFGQPNFYAGFLLLSLPLCWGRLGWLGGLGGLVITGGILVSGSRAAIILLPFLLFPLLVRKIKLQVLGFFICLFILLSAFFFSAKFNTGIIWQEVIEPRFFEPLALRDPGNSVEKRYYIWPLFWDLAGKKPFLGSGLENIGAVYSEFFIANKHALFEAHPNQSSVMYRLRDLNINSTHSYFLDLLISSGILGFLSYGVLICLLVSSAKSQGVFVALLVYLIWSQFQNQSVVHLVFFWMLVGLIDSNQRA